MILLFWCAQGMPIVREKIPVHLLSSASDRASWYCSRACKNHIAISEKPKNWGCLFSTHLSHGAVKNLPHNARPHFVTLLDDIASSLKIMGLNNRVLLFLQRQLDGVTNGQNFSYRKLNPTLQDCVSPFYAWRRSMPKGLQSIGPDANQLSLCVSQVFST